jgi:hypothetical protein
MFYDACGYHQQAGQSRCDDIERLTGRASVAEWEPVAPSIVCACGCVQAGACRRTIELRRANWSAYRLRSPRDTETAVVGQRCAPERELASAPDCEAAECAPEMADRTECGDRFGSARNC